MTLRNGFKLADWTVYPLEGKFESGDTVTRVQPKSMDVLLVLAGRSPHVVTRDDLLLEVWGERAVSDEPLTRCIGELRRTLGDTRSEPEFIETIPKRGYRLKCEPELLLADARSDGELSPAQRELRLNTLKKIGIGAIVLVAAVALGVGFDRLLDGSDRSDMANDAVLDTFDPPPNTIAVLPFVNLSGDDTREYFAEGISEELLNVLARHKNLKVTSRSSAFSFKDRNVDVPTIARQLQVAYILEGSVRLAEDRVRISAQLVDTASDSHIWTNIYDFEMVDIFSTQDDIAGRVVEALKIELLNDASTGAATDPEAYNLVLQARYVGRQFSTDALIESVDLLEDAVAIAPDYAEAWAALSRGYRRQASQGLIPYDEGYTLARDAANRALFLDPENVAANRGLAFIARNYDLDLAAAAQHFSRALRIDPSDAATMRGAASLADALGRSDDAVAIGEHAVHRDPVSPLSTTAMGLFYLHARRYDDAIDMFRRTRTQSPDYLAIQNLISMALMQKGDLDDALAEARLEKDEGYRLIAEAMILHRLGRTEEADAALEDLIAGYELDAAYNIASVYAVRDDADKTFEWLDKAVDYNDTGLSEIVNEPLFDNVTSDNRWQPFLASIGRAPDVLAAVELDLPTLD